MYVTKDKSFFLYKGGFSWRGVWSNFRAGCLFCKKKKNYVNLLVGSYRTNDKYFVEMGPDTKFYIFVTTWLNVLSLLASVRWTSCSKLYKARTTAKRYVRYKSRESVQETLPCAWGFQFIFHQYLKLRSCCNLASKLPSLKIKYHVN